MAFMTGALIGAGASLLGSIIGGKASKDAAQTSANAATQASDASVGLQREMWQQGVQDQAPWRAAGVNALAQMQDPSMAPGQWQAAPAWRSFTMADYQQDPGYAFRLSEGMKSLEQSAAARGGLLSGAALKGITRYGQDYASNEYSKAYDRYNTNQAQSLDRYNATQMNQLARSDVPYNRLAAQAGIGQTTATNMANQAGSYGANAGNTLAVGINAAGQAQAAGQLGQSAAWNNGINTAVSSYQQGQLINSLRQQPYYPTTTPYQAASLNIGYAPTDRDW
jgi:hypothetical protein